MSDNRDKKAFGLSAVLAMAAVMVLGVSIRDGNAAANDTASLPSDQSSLLFSSTNTGSVEPAGPMLARKGVKREHGRPGHASATSDESLFARKGGKGGVKFEHGRPGHASTSPEDTLYARKGRPKPERRG